MKFKKYIRNFFWVASEKAIRLISGLFVGILIAKSLGPEDFGRYSYVLSWCGIWGSLAWLGVGETVVKDLVKRRFDESILLGSAFLLRLSGACISFILCIFLSYVVNDNLGASQSMFLIIGLALCFAEITGGMWMWFQARSELSGVILARNTSIIAGLFFKLGVLVLGGSLIALAWASAVETVVLCFGVYLAYRIAGGRPSEWRFQRRETLLILKESLPLALSALVISLNSRVDQIIIGWFLGAEAVGTYAVAVRMSEIWWMIPPVMMMVLAPKFIYETKERNELALRCARLSRLLLIPALIICILTLSFGENVIFFLMGSEYSSAAHILIVHIWISIFVFIEAPIIQYLIVRDMRWLIAKKTITAVAANAVLGVLLVQRYGAIGAVWASIFGQLISLVLVASLPGAKEFRSLLWLSLLGRKIRSDVLEGGV